MRLSWRLLLLRTYHQKRTSFSCRKVQSSSISSPFHTQSRTQHTQTTNSRNPIYPYESFESKIGLDFSPAHGVTKEKRDELEKELKSVADNRNAIEEKSDEFEEDLTTILEKRMGCVEEGMEYDFWDPVKEIASKAKWNEDIWDRSYIRAVYTLIKLSNEDDIERELNRLEIDQDLIKNVLEGFESNPNVAKRFFHFLLNKDGDQLDFECYGALYNSMLCVFGVNRLFGEFWDLAEFMNTKRCRVSLSYCEEKRHLIHMDTWDKLSDFYRKHGLASELQKLGRFVVIQYMDNRMTNIAILLDLIWPHMINFQICGDFVKFVLEHARGREALGFLRWIAGSYNLCKRDEQTYDFVASVLDKEDEKYYKLVDRLKMSGQDHEKEIVTEDISKCYEFSDINEISEFYEYAVDCSDTVPSANCCIYLIMKIRLYDNELWSGNVNPDASMVIRAFERNGGILTDSDVSNVFDMLASGNKIEDLYYLADQAIHSTYLEVRDHPCSFTESYTREIDRQRRAHLMFSDLQKEISGDTI